MPKWVEGKVVKNIHWHENLFSLQVEAEVAPFVAGQFTSLALDIDGERIARPYSFLSSPGQQPLEFFFYVATDGVLSNALVKLKPGDRLWLKEQANGFFTLAEVPASRDLWMLATGTGVAPYFQCWAMKKSGSDTVMSCWYRAYAANWIYSIRIRWQAIKRLTPGAFISSLLSVVKPVKAPLKAGF